MRCFFLLLILICLGPTLFAQYVIKADSVKLTNYDSAELILENHTQNVPGFLYNKGNGRTEFRKALIPINDTLYLFGKDTLNINKGFKYYSVSGGSSGSSAPNRVFKVYSQDFSGTTLTHTFTLPGWNVDYSASTPPDTSHTLAATIDIEMTLPVNIPANTVVTVQFQGTTIYTMTVTGAALTAEHYAIGTVKVNQDLKYPSMFYIKGAVETMTSTGVITTTNTAYRMYPASFTSPTLTFTISGTTTLVRVGATYTIDKKGPGNWIFN